MLLTKRPDHLKRYAGQVALPGGAFEPTDESLQFTALRETHEEVGIPPEAVEIYRELDWQRTTLGHAVKPFVGRVRQPVTLIPDADEVETILYLPVERISPRLFEVGVTRGDAATASEVPPRQRAPSLASEFLRFSLDGHVVWGLTARILHAAFIAQEDGSCGAAG